MKSPILHLPLYLPLGFSAPDADIAAISLTAEDLRVHYADDNTVHYVIGVVNDKPQLIPVYTEARRK